MAGPNLTAPLAVVLAVLVAHGAEAIRVSNAQAINKGSASGASSGSAFVGREPELSLALETLTRQPAASLLVVLGAPRVGKTAFLRELSRRLDARGVNVAYLDSRQRSLRDATSLAQALAAAASSGWLTAAASRSASNVNLTALASLAAALERLQITGAGGGICGEGRRSSSSFSSLVLPRPRIGGGGGSRGAASSAVLLEVLRLLDSAIEALKPTEEGPAGGAPRPRPQLVLVIDDAAALQQLGTGPQAAALGPLLQWLMRVGGEAGLVHVVLASGDAGFLDWLGTAVPMAYLTAEVLGELTQPEALELLKRQVPSDQHPGLTGNASAIYEVCGGNPGLLQTCATSFRGDWLQAALHATKDVRRTVRSALSPSPNDGWARWQFAKAVSAVLAGPAEHGSLAEALGRNGAWALRAMMGRGLLALRPFSAWQRDVPASAWLGNGTGGGADGVGDGAGVGDDGVLVVAGGGAVLHGMRQLRMPAAAELLREEEAAEGKHREYRRWEE